jgi:ADP-ribose pyrophosphatase YjhB (NUDIX family)
LRTPTWCGAKFNIFGKIGLPVGKVDPGESPVQALLLEVREEGLAVSGVFLPQPVKNPTLSLKNLF